MPDTVRILFLADSHLGFDLPVHPRVRRRRRGHDFLNNYRKALAAGLERRVDLVVHGGDVFHRARVPPSLAFQAFAPLVEIADRGVAVYVVPGNHERSRIPHVRFAAHPRISIFDRPRTFTARVRGVDVALSGFPYERRGVRAHFPSVLGSTGWRARASGIRVLCMHHCVEGATVGPGGFTFRAAPDVIRGRDFPAGLAAILTGHVHRHQVLVQDLRGRRLEAPVLYPGSVERTSMAEKDERKGYMLLEVEPDAFGGRLVRWEFCELLARPMLVRELRTDEGRGLPLEPRIRTLVSTVPPDAVLRIRVVGRVNPSERVLLTAARLRALAPPTMNVDLARPR